MSHDIVSLLFVNPYDAQKDGVYINPRTMESRVFMGSLRKSAVNPETLESAAGISCVTARWLSPDRLRVVQVSGYNSEDGLFCLCF